ncbi:hypothetical protein I4U23_030948 [Adineta vaga]|nr:hypothetical protein I4U23_030948 [Adineta vaga]
MSSKSSKGNSRLNNTISQFDRGSVQILNHCPTLKQQEVISLQILFFALLEVFSSTLTNNDPNKTRPLVQLLLHLFTTSRLLPASMNMSAIAINQLYFVKNYVRILQATIQTALNIIQQPPPPTTDGATVISVLEKEFAKVLLTIPTPPVTPASNISIDIPQQDIQLKVPLPLTMNGTVSSNGFDNIVVLRYARDFYELSKIGKGAFGSVFRAKNRLDDCTYAIKKIVFKDNSDRTRRQAKYALREVRVLASLSHPNIVQYHCAWLELVPCETTIPRQKSASPHLQTQKSLPLDDRFDSFDKLIEFKNSSSSIKEEKSQTKYSSTSPDDDDEDTTGESDLGLQSQTSNIQSHRKSHSDRSNISFTRSKSLSQYSTTIESSKTKQLVPFQTTHDELDSTTPTPQSKYINSRLVLFIQMQFCDTTLYDWLRHRDQVIIDETSDTMKIVSYTLNELGQSECWHLFKQLLSAVQYLHSQSIVHRDIKPRNILLSYNKKDRSSVHVRLGDFGLATIFGSEVTSKSPSHFKTDESAGVGTPLYAPPEQLNSHHCIATAYSDSYSLGIVLFELFNIFVTESERCRRLSDLRAYMEVGEIFAENYPFETSLIEQLVQIESEKRLSVEEILMKYSKEIQQRIRKRQSSTKQMIIDQLQETLRDKEKRIQELELQLESQKA